MRIGVDYYPEHWDKSRWKTDIELMAKAGIEVVRIGEFAWSLYEPEEGRFEFAWMDEVLDFMNLHQMKVVLCTPSATPPKWMTDRFPDIMQRDIHGCLKEFGTRKHYCFNSETYREKVRILNEMIAERYGKNEAVEGWQIDNELGWSNTTRCYCENCRKKFQTWLKTKYGTIDTLNDTYGTVFWSQHYNSFEEVIIPRAGACYDTCHDTQGQNPALLLDYDRFCSDSVISFTKESADIIRKYSDRPVTTNLLDASVNSGTGIDYFKLSKELDFVTWDNYVEFQWGKAQKETVSRDHALLRSYKKQPFWVMEQQSGPCGWSKMGPAPTPGKLRLWTYQAIAGGADTVVYFRWRTCPFGTEELWHGILGCDGKENRRYREIAGIGAEMKQLSRHYKALMPHAETAILKSFDCEWSQTIHRQVENLHYDDCQLEYYKAFTKLGGAVDFVSPGDDFKQYKLILAPLFMMSDAETKQNLEAYIQAGGAVLFSFRSGIKDMYNNMLTDTAPGFLSDMTGIEIDEYDPLFEKETSVSGVFGNSTAKLWCDVITPVKADVLGVYTEDYYAGRPCFTVNKYGLGKAYYLGCDLEENAMKNLAVFLGQEHGLNLLPYEIEGIEAVTANDGEKDVLFLLNHLNRPAVVPVKGAYTEMITGSRGAETVRLDPFGVAVLEYVHLPDDSGSDVS